MGWKDKLQNYIDSKKEQLHRGIEITEQMKAEKLRKKIKKYEDMPDGTRKSIHAGIMMKKKPWEVMQDEWSRRKYNRKSKK